jgi:hypothetical protein
MLADMADGPLPRHEVALRLAVAAIVLAAVAAVVIWDPILSLDLAASISVPDVPDLPKWLLFLLGKGKYYRRMRGAAPQPGVDAVLTGCGDR